MEPLDETAPPRPSEFQSELCAAMEHEARRAEALGVRVVQTHGRRGSSPTLLTNRFATLGVPGLALTASRAASIACSKLLSFSLLGSCCTSSCDQHHPFVDGDNVEPPSHGAMCKDQRQTESPQ